jgi:ribosomal protein S18 acetylase RimI-like enzyme
VKVSFFYAKQENLQWLKERDCHVSEEVLRKKISDKEILIAESGNEIVGWLRFGFFWDIYPFMNLIIIDEEYQRKGIGKQLVLFWEEEMKKRKHKYVLTSTQSDEEAQHFYRKLGYKDAGSLILPGEVLEIIFIKTLQSET